MSLAGAPAQTPATPEPWWKHAVIYEIYPRSFQDSNGDGIDNDLPVGVATINSGIGANFFQADLRVSKFFTMPREFGRIEAIFEMYNVFNNINPASYQGNELGNDFGQPTAFAGDPLQGEARLIQLGVRYSF